MPINPLGTNGALPGLPLAPALPCAVPGVCGFIAGRWGAMLPYPLVPVRDLPGLGAPSTAIGPRWLG